ncbi:MAG TPA: proteobacterial dedicated sortase system response regulator [Oceanospirillales bacterium]|nr:proteobacterial dedicated sortase system response regulator [Oceanospirillales bacterium]
MSRKRIVIVEDEPSILANYQAALQRQGYQTRGHQDLASAKLALAQALPDLVIIDVGLGDEPDGGFELCRFLRNQSESLPILFLTARDNEIDMVSGLRLGADDYLSKDISLPHLLARVAALFRRQDLVANKSADNLITQGHLKILTDNLQVFWREQAIDLTVTEFWMIVSLARHQGHVKTRDQLMSDANIYVDESTITSHIKRIRKKFLAFDPQFDCIDTVHGMGYRWKS